MEQVKSAKASLVRLLANEPGFVGAGVSSGRLGEHELVVYVSSSRSPALKKTPKEWRGVRVRVETRKIPVKY